ncbi:hypothetical protein B0H16DRAFT_1693539 [Mycena metata]|uniref:Uncharacterized protein n=1 Tax=Mycena metata TaxID=1033252 RepID=A0AAD7IJ34_9AGAR|nr:hypothetical protein B0H16DRAFT_1693539 [Mycena metata]
MSLYSKKEGQGYAYTETKEARGGEKARLENVQQRRVRADPTESGKLGPRARMQGMEALDVRGEQTGATTADLAATPAPELDAEVGARADMDIIRSVGSGREWREHVEDAPAVQPVLALRRRNRNGSERRERAVWMSGASRRVSAGEGEGGRAGRGGEEAYRTAGAESAWSRACGKESRYAAATTFPARGRRTTVSAFRAGPARRAPIHQRRVRETQCRRDLTAEESEVHEGRKA